jgi:hypothetical protein
MTALVASDNIHNVSCVAIDYIEYDPSGQKLVLVAGSAMAVAFFASMLFAVVMLFRLIYNRCYSRFRESRIDAVHYSPFWSISVAFYAFICLFSLVRVSFAGTFYGCRSALTLSRTIYREGSFSMR